MIQTIIPTTTEGLETRRFDPASRLIKVKGGQLYLQVRDRLIWLREEHPEARITTQLLDFHADTEMWIVKAEITILLVDKEGQVREALGSGLGQETERDFPAGALEKAETKSIGRALASLGYGTQFALEFDEGDHFADAPINATYNGYSKHVSKEELRQQVTDALALDSDAQAKLQEGGRSMETADEVELARTLLWLKARAMDSSKQNGG